MKLIIDCESLTDSEYTKLFNSLKELNFELLDINGNSLDENHNTIRLENGGEYSQLITLFKERSVNYIISNNQDMIFNFTNTELKDNILTLLEAYNYLLPQLDSDNNFSLNSPSVADLDINDKIFDTLKANYPEFTEWFMRMQIKKRPCAVFYDANHNIAALMIYKLEDEEIKLKENNIPKTRRLKISTFIVTMNGYKFGEALIKIAVDECIKENVNCMYLTHFVDENDSLVYLIKEYGFTCVGLNDRGEHIFIKLLRPERANNNKITDFVKFNMKYFPSFYDGPKVNKFIIPIKWTFYKRLFQSPMEILQGYPLSSINSIEKAYISHSNISSINAGDILLFYISHKKSSISDLGIAKIIRSENDTQKISTIIGKRSVYTEQELKNDSGKRLIIKFNHIFKLKNPVKYEILFKENILNGPPQSILQIDDGKYEKIKKIGDIDESFTFN